MSTFNVTLPSDDVTFHVVISDTDTIAVTLTTASTAWGQITGNIANQTDLQNELDLKEDKANKGVANGYCPLDANELVPIDNLGGSPTFSGLTLTGSLDMGTNLFTGGIPRLPIDRDIDNLHSIVDRVYVDEAVASLAARYYMLDDDDPTGYKLTSLDASSDPTASYSASDLSDGDLIMGWIQPSGDDLTTLIAGVYAARIFAEKTAGNKTLRLYWQLVERKSDDSEVVIATSNESDEITSKSLHEISALLTDDYTIDDGSRIVGKIYASVSGSGNAPSVTLYYEGDEDSAWQIPVNVNLLDGRYLRTDQSTPQTVNGGAPIFDDGLDSNDLIHILLSGTKVSVDDSVGLVVQRSASGNDAAISIISYSPGQSIINLGFAGGETDIRLRGIHSTESNQAFYIDLAAVEEALSLVLNSGQPWLGINTVPQSMLHIKGGSFTSEHSSDGVAGYIGPAKLNDLFSLNGLTDYLGINGVAGIQMGVNGSPTVQIDDDFIIKLGDSAGANRVAIEDVDEAELFSVDSDGNVTLGLYGGSKRLQFYYLSDFEVRFDAIDPPFAIGFRATDYNFWGNPIKIWGLGTVRTASNYERAVLDYDPVNDYFKVGTQAGGTGTPGNLLLDPAGGYVFFSNVDTNLYRSAANVLKTDDKFVVALELEVGGDLNHDGENVGFYGATPVTQPTVTGVRGGGGTANLLSALADLGLVVDNTTAAKGEIKLPVGSPAEMTAQIDQDKDLRLLFDDTTVEHAVWQFRMPDDYGGNLVAKIQYAMASATSGKVDFEVSVMAVSSGDAQDLDADSYDAANTANATVPGTAGYLGELTVTLTNDDDVAAGDYVRIKLERDADDATDDTATGDCEVRNVVLEYEVA